MVVPERLVQVSERSVVVSLLLTNKSQLIGLYHLLQSMERLLDAVAAHRKCTTSDKDKSAVGTAKLLTTARHVVWIFSK